MSTSISSTDEFSEKQLRLPPSPGNAPPSPAGTQIIGDEELDKGFFARLIPMNKPARVAFHQLAIKHLQDPSSYHGRFLQLDEPSQSSDIQTGSFTLSLTNLPEFPALGWRIGRGKSVQKNFGVDILLRADDDQDIAGSHARFTWMKGGGGFFIRAENIRGKPVSLNGEVFSQDRRLIPFYNTIGIGEFYFSLKFPKRTTREEEQFQAELLNFYRDTLMELAPMILPTPSQHEVRIGDWILRNPIARGAFGAVSAVTHGKTGEPAAMKEIWQTRHNSANVKREVAVVKRLLGIEHVRFL